MIVKGGDIVIYINGEVVMCFRSSTLQVTADVIGKSTIGSGNWKEFEGNVLSWQVTAEGLIYVEPAFTIHDAYDLMTALENVFAVFAVDVFGTVQYYFGDAIITSIQEQGNVNDNASFNISLQGTGELQRDDEVIYGAAPEGFEINTENADTPSPGFTQLTFIWNEAAPVPVNYTVEVTNTDTSTTTLYDEITEIDGWNYDAVTADNYVFRIRSHYFNGIEHSEWSDGITWP